MCGVSSFLHKVTPQTRIRSSSVEQKIGDRRLLQVPGSSVYSSLH